MRSAVAVVLLMLAAAGASAQAATGPLSLRELPALVLQNDPSAAISAQATALAYHAYRGTLAQALPQIDLSTSYGLAYTPELSGQITSYEDKGTNVAGAKLSISQLLPTAGSLGLVLEDTMTVATAGSRTESGVTKNPDPGYAQAPKLSVSLAQPLFVNGKIMDLQLFPATQRKAELGYLGQSTANTAQRNALVYQAAQLYLNVLALRKSVKQTEASISVTEGNLRSLEKSHELGSVTDADLLDARIGLSRQRQSLLELRSSLAKTERLLGHSVGQEGIGELDDSIPEIDFEPGRDEAVAKALQAHPGIRQKSLAAEEKKVDSVISGQQYAATLALGFSVAPRYPSDAARTKAYGIYTAESVPASFSELFGENAGIDYSFSANLTLHLFDGGRRRESRAAAQAAVQVSESSLTAQRQAILDQLDADLELLQSLRERIELLGESVELARGRLESAKRLLELGGTTELDVAAQGAELEARSNELWRAQADLFLTTLDLRSLTGEALDAAIQGAGR